MKKYKILLLIIIPLIYVFLSNEKIIENEREIEINEIVEYKIYKSNEKKEIANIDYDDMKIIKISKKKMEDILEYKEYMGTIKNIDDLIVIPRFTKEDVDKLKNFFKDSENVSYKVQNINQASKKQLKYLGLSPRSIERLKTKGKVNNLIELEEIIGKDILNIKSSIVFE